MCRVLFDSYFLCHGFAGFCPESQVRWKHRVGIPPPWCHRTRSQTLGAERTAAPSRLGSGGPLRPAQPAATLRIRRLSVSCSHRLLSPTQSHLRGGKLPQVLRPRRGLFGLVSCECDITAHLCPPRPEAECSPDSPAPPSPAGGSSHRGRFHLHGVVLWPSFSRSLLTF